MDRASDSGSEGWGFESLPVYQIKERIPTRGILSFISPSGREGLEQSNATVRGTVAADGSSEANLYLLPLGADANESLPAYQEKATVLIETVAFLTKSTLAGGINYLR